MRRRFATAQYQDPSDFLKARIAGIRIAYVSYANDTDKATPAKVLAADSNIDLMLVLTLGATRGVTPRPSRSPTGAGASSTEASGPSP